MKRVVLIGAGRMAETHFNQLKEFKTVELYGVYDLDRIRAEAFASRFALPHIYTSLEDLNADLTLDGILLCHGAPAHVPDLLRLIAGGHRYFFCEKPILRRLDEAETLLSAVAGSGARIMIGHHRKHHPGYRKMYEMIHSGELGSLRMAKVHFSNPGYKREWGNYFASYEQSGGTTLDMLTHFLDLTNWMLGQPLHGYAQALRLEQTLPSEAPPCDYVSAAVTYPGGVICGLESSYQRYGEKYDRLEVYGDRATAIFRFNEPVLRVHRKNEFTEYALGDVNPYQRQMQSWTEMLETGEERQTTLAEGISAARTALGLMYSAENNTPMKF